MTQEHKDALHKAVHAHKHTRERISAEALRLAQEIADAEAQRVAVDAAGNTAGEEKTNNA